MDTFAALALASIPPSRDVMCDKPRKSSDFIITRLMAWDIFGVGTAFLVVLLWMISFVEHQAGGMNDYRLTFFFTFFVLLQFWNLFNARVMGTTDSAFRGLSKSYGILLVLLFILVGQFLIVEFGGSVFRTEPLNWVDWLVALGVSSFVLWIGEFTRFIRRLINKSK